MKFRFILYIFPWTFLLYAQKPQVAITFVIDQFAYHELLKLSPYFSGGLKKLYEQGIVYTNAFHPHGMPETGPGHATLGTSSVARDHGIVANKITFADGKETQCDADTADYGAVFTADGFSKEGKSARNIRVDTLADQLMLASSKEQKNTVFSLSLKSRAAIGMSGRLGNPIWFDTTTGLFTSSKAFFKELPDWVKKFNEELNLSTKKSFTWKLAHESDSPAYQFPNTDNYKNAQITTSVIDKEHIINERDKEPFDLFIKTPEANQLLMNLAERCFALHKPQTEEDRLVLYISLSGLDKISHLYGPESKEALDMIYHMDQQIGVFMDTIEKDIAPEKIMYILTSDHGASPILANLHERGIEFAQIHSNRDFSKELNELLAKELGITNLIKKTNMPWTFFDNDVWDKQSTETQQKIIHILKQFIRKKPYVQDVWHIDELYALPVEEHDIRWGLKNQLFNGRSGHIIMLLQPYNYFTKYTSGMTHITPYNYDRQVPLLVYQKNNHEKKRMYQRVYVTQIGVTLADLLNVQRPSASQFEVLPGIFKKNSKNTKGESHEL